MFAIANPSTPSALTTAPDVSPPATTSKLSRPISVSAIFAIAVGPAVLAYRFWGLGVQRVGPGVAGFFANLTPLFAAVMSSLVLGDIPQTYHAIAFAMIVGGIVVSSKR